MRIDQRLRSIDVQHPFWLPLEFESGRNHSGVDLFRAAIEQRKLTEESAVFPLPAVVGGVPRRLQLDITSSDQVHLLSYLPFDHDFVASQRKVGSHRKAKTAREATLQPLQQWAVYHERLVDRHDQLLLLLRREASNDLLLVQRRLLLEIVR